MSGRSRALIVGMVLWAAPAWAACESVFLPDLAPPANVATTFIATSFPVPPQPETAQGEGLYPFSVVTTPDGTVTIYQAVGDPSKAWRQWTGITRASLVSWYHEMTYPIPEKSVWLVPYVTLPHTAPAGVAPTWAYRIPMRFDATTPASLALSTPVNLGETYNVGILNQLPYVVGINLQIVLQLCH